MGSRRAASQLSLQVLPLTSQLALGHAQSLRGAPPGNERRVEAITAARRFTVDFGKVRGDCGDRGRAFAKADELRVCTVAARAAPQHGLGEQALAPHSDQAGGVEMPGMEGP